MGKATLRLLRFISRLGPCVAKPVRSHQRFFLHPNAERPLPEILTPSIPERIQLMEDRSDSIATGPHAVPLSAELRKELDLRLLDQAVDPGVGKPWPEIKARLLTSQ